MQSHVFVDAAYRLLVAAVDLGWTPPAWRSGPHEPPFEAARRPADWVALVARTIATQRALGAERGGRRAA
ncbi:MAG: hypothetical protein D6689_13685 [Deltaproteobacteria bacterium]|nr:MAG: hypothetical protein D6689_13685 [Deltaproteobacteria bacterium]